MKVRVATAATPEAIAHRLALEIGRAARAAVRRRGRFALVLSGGRTPQPLFRQLAAGVGGPLPWEKTDVFFSDERAVAPSDPRSNFGLADRLLFRPLGRRGPRVHRMAGERRPLGRAAEEYAADLAACLGPPRGGGAGRPAPFDLAVLGVGPDGHTASIFPGRPVGRGDVVVVPRAALPPRVARLSLSLAALGRSREVVFLVTGGEKRTLVSAILKRPPGPRRRWPAARVRAEQTVAWYLDRAAAPPRRAAPRPGARRRPGARAAGAGASP